MQIGHNKKNRRASQEANRLILLARSAGIEPTTPAETLAIVADILDELEERRAAIIRMRFGIGRDEIMTLEEISQIYGVTRERIRQIEASGLEHLSKPERKKRLQALLGI